jgi:hypothetical protein
MRRLVVIFLAGLAISISAIAQTAQPPAQPAPAAPADEAVERALAAAPRNLRDGATVIKWKPDQSYDTLRKGTNRLVCYDQSGEPSEQPYSVQCTSIGNLERVAQNKKFELQTDRTLRQKEIDAAEAAGTRVKPEFGSVFYTIQGPDKEKARLHVTVAVPGATAASLGLPDNNKQGGAWIMNAGTSTAHIMIPGS